MSLLELLCSVDDFWQDFAPSWQQDLLTSGQRQRVRPTRLHSSEIMTILILFQQSHDRTFKAYYTEYVQRHLRSEFPALVSYQRFASVDAHRACPSGAPICIHNWATVPGSASSTPPHLPSAAIHASTNTECLMDEPLAGRRETGWLYGFKLQRARQRSRRDLGVLLDVRQRR